MSGCAVASSCVDRFSASQYVCEARRLFMTDISTAVPAPLRIRIRWHILRVGPLSSQQPPSRPAPPLGGCAHSLVIPNITPHASAVGGLRGKVGRNALGPAARQRPSCHKHEGDQRDEKQEVCDLEALIVGTT